MKKNIIAALVLASLSSCARTYIREWKEGEVTACGNQAASREKIEQTAREKCGGGPVKEIGGGVVDSGQVYVGYGMFKNTQDNCLKFRCGEASGPAPASAELKR